MENKKSDRRSFLTTASTVAAAAAATPYFFSGTNVRADDAQATAKNDRPLLGCIGTGSRWNGVGPNAMAFADCVAVCDVDRSHAEKGQKKVFEKQKREVEIHEDYRRILDNKNIDVVTIVTPDHWHSKIAIEAMQAGKDVYCEKPLTLTIEEGKLINKVQRETGRVFQVGTQQRSEMGQRFLQAIALIRAGRIGDVKTVHVAIGGAPSSGPIPVAEPPSHLNWEMWLGQTPVVDFRMKQSGKRGNSRCHYEFRWWYEYSGGKLTDWGAHHVDIAQWAIDQNGEGQGPSMIEPLMVKHPCSYLNGMPLESDRYNTATEFKIKATFANDVEMFIRHSCQEDLGFNNGILFEGTKGRFIVNRGKIEGAPVNALADNPLPEDAIAQVYNGKDPAKGNAHMQNFFECIKTRKLPISDVHTHHRALTTCHLSNIAIRLGRPLKWDAKSEQIVGDDLANAWQSRQQRKGYEITV